MAVKLAGEARYRLEKTGESLWRGPQRVSLGWKAHASHPGSVDRARVSTLHSARPPIRGGKDRDEKKEEKRKEERKRGCALINMSYKNAGVHNLHEPKTESKNRYALSLSLCLVRFLTPFYRSLFLFLFSSRLSFHRVTRNTMDKWDFLRAIEIREQEEESGGWDAEERREREREGSGGGHHCLPGERPRVYDDRVHPPGTRARRKGWQGRRGF